MALIFKQAPKLINLKDCLVSDFHILVAMEVKQIDLALKGIGLTQVGKKGNSCHEWPQGLKGLYHNWSVVVFMNWLLLLLLKRSKFLTLIQKILSWLPMNIECTKSARWLVLNLIEVSSSIMLF
jgi:hypothetical protein